MFLKQRTNATGIAFHLFAASSLYAQFPADWDAPMVDAEYKSKTTSYSLMVTPRSPEGRGPGLHQLRRGTELLWSLELPYALRGVAVSDDGTVAGVAYTKEASSGAELQHIVLIGSDGEELGHDVLKRHRAGGRLHSNSPALVPYAVEVVMNEFSRQAIVGTNLGISRGDLGVLMVYDLQNGRRLRQAVPDKRLTEGRGGLDLADICIVEGTPLVLVHWRVRTVGVAVAVFDMNGEIIWSMALPGDCQRLFSDDPACAEGGFYRQKPIIACNLPAQFSLNILRSRGPIHFAVKEDQGDMWVIKRIE